MEKLEIISNIIALFSKFFAKLGNVLSEEQVCKIIIDPFIEKVWGFSYAPNELNEAGTYETEPKVMVGHDTKVFPDRVLLCHNNKKMVIEAKGTDISLDEYVGQLQTAVIASGASVGILWNGTEMRVFLTDTDGKMDTAPYKTIFFLSITDADKEFLAKLFDPRHTINDAQMKRERDVRKKDEEETALRNSIVNHLIEKTLQPTIEDIKEPFKQFKKQTQVQASTLTNVLTQVTPFFIKELKNRLVGDEIASIKTAEARKNKIEPEEYAIAQLAEHEIARNHGSVDWIDDDEPSRSMVRRADTKKTILWIVGEVDDNGYRFKGISFPNIQKNRGKIIPISDPKEVVNGDLFKKLLAVYDHINDPKDDWANIYSTTIGD